MAISKRQIEERKMRQERILAGALEVFKAKGMESATMEEIAEKSGFGKATLYYYFHSKEEVFSAILENGWNMLWINLEPVISGSISPRQTFIQILLKTAETIRSHPGLFRFLFNAPKQIIFEVEPWKKYQNRIYSILQSLLEDGVKAGEFPNINTKLLFKAMGGLFMGIVLMGDRNKPISEKDIEELLTQLIMNPTHQQ
jgi:AcrR family transcriptional regulator